MKSLATIKSANSGSFVYTPPAAAFGALRTLVKVQLCTTGEGAPHVSIPILEAVLRGLRRANPAGRIVVIDGARSAVTVKETFETLGALDLLDDEMRAADTEGLLMREYPNLLQPPIKFAEMTAPEYLGDYECCISLAVLHQQNASLYNLKSVYPRSIYGADDSNTHTALDVPEIEQDIYFTVGHYFHGAVVELPGKIIWGDDLIAVDETAMRSSGVTVPDYLKNIRSALKTIST